MNEKFVAGRAGQARFTDVQCMMESVLDGWLHESIQLSPGPGTGQHRFIETNALRLDASDWSTGVLVRGAGATGAVCFGLVDGDPAAIRFRGRPLAPARIPLVQSEVEFEYAAPEPTAALVLTIDKDVFDRHAQALWRTELTTNAAYTLPLAGMEHGMAVVKLLKNTLHNLSGEPALLQSPRVADLVTDNILTTLLAGSPAEPARVIMPHRHHLAREAAALLRTETDPPISIKTLCERLRISWRALDQGFWELYGVSPKTYLRISRLHHVKRQLAVADPALTNVTAVAVSWGFFQLGRFAVEYRRLFGEKPSDTLWKGAR